MDLALYNAEGKRFRFHPGAKRKNDAQLIESSTSHRAPEPEAAQQVEAEPAAFAYREAPLTYTREFASRIPQVDRMGRRRMFELLQRLHGQKPLELTKASVESFPWWLWLPTIGPILNDVIGTGITRIALMQTWVEETGYVSGARFLVVHQDKKALLLNAYHGEGRRRPYYHQALETGSEQYEWWVGWKATETWEDNATHKNGKQDSELHEWTHSWY